MDITLRVLLSALTAFAVTALVSRPVIAFAKRAKASQTILFYVDKHEGKKGTPTMGGIMFLIGVSVAVLVFGRQKLGIVSLCVTLGYALIGFLDDFIKVKLKRNLGLKAYQKIVGQLGIAAIVSAFCYTSGAVGSLVRIPFTHIYANFGWAYIPFCAFVFIAMSNAVNLTDGLDGLVAASGSVYFAAFGVMTAFAAVALADGGRTLLAEEYESLCVFAFAFFGALIAFFWCNSNPAGIFMGDTGSLAVGGAAACVAVFSQNALFAPIIGIMFVVSCISVILQVLHFKRTKKRLFLMAPFHHHLEYKGIKECKIVSYYAVITLVAAFVALVAYIV